LRLILSYEFIAKICCALLIRHGEFSPTPVLAS
jgi:hypothetical protein